MIDRNVLKNKFTGKILFDEKMSNHTSYGVGGRVNAYISELRRNENIEAFWVTDMYYDSYRLTEDEKRLTRVDDGAAHITISHKKGLKPKEASTMFTNPTYTRQAVGYVEGIFKWIPFNKQETI